MPEKSELLILTENDNCQYFIDNGYPVAIFKIEKNNDRTYSNFVELLNCSEQDIKFIETAINIYSYMRVGDSVE